MAWTDKAREAALAARRAAMRYQENPADSAARSALTRFALHSRDYHPGAIIVYRAGRLGRGGVSFTKSLATAKRHLYAGKSKITSLRISKSTPALDLNKLNPRSRYSREREVFVVRKR